MFKKAFVDVGCAKLTWTVEKVEAPKPSLEERNCHDSHNHPDVHRGDQEDWADIFCQVSDKGQIMRAGEPEKYTVAGSVLTGGKADLGYRITWIEGCDIVGEQNVVFPVDGDPSINCAGIMKENYNRCKFQNTRAYYANPPGQSMSCMLVSDC